MSRLNSLLALFGWDLAKTARNAAALPWFVKSYRSFKALNSELKSQFEFGKLYPCLDDKIGLSGIGAGHYFHQDLLVARKIFERNPRRHADIGSRVDGFVAHVAVFRQLDVFDIRPLLTTTRNIEFRKLDLTKDLDSSLLGRYDSISCLHALEHFGLGRYGDELDPLGHVKGFESMSKLLSQGGSFYLSVPMGFQRVEFNAHRVFSLSYLREMCERIYQITSLSYVDDNGCLFEDVPLDSEAARRNFDCKFGLAILDLKKR